jgi:hypothetical protein
MITIKPDSSAEAVSSPPVPENPTSSPAIPAGHKTVTVPMDGVANGPDCVSEAGNKTVSGYNGSDPY